MTRRAIGRKLKTETTIPTVSTVTDNTSAIKKTFILKSGQSATFFLIKIPHNEIEQTTYVDFEVNGRDQSQLTKESLADLETIKLHQFFPAIAIRDKKTNQLSILDGSRKRAAALLFGADLEVLESEDEISVADAKQLAKDIQTAKEHNLREVGLRLKAIQTAINCDNKTLAQQESMSESKISRALQAATVPQEMIDIFLDASVLNFPDYKFLLSVGSELGNKGTDLSEFCSQVKAQLITADDDSKQFSDDAKVLALKLIKSHLNQINTDEKKDKVVVTTLKEFSKDKFIKRKEKGRLVTFELSRMPAELQQRIESEIMKYLQEE